ncbi:MAG: FliM/FliN family flagellar motor C-terminal domain-containing protein [Candidatus Eremiobacteraeota bacterium]|nr:FliM/FliN family flagellar motor C-terminal domain-containing protein [Candidatus Eremiobacteraeota bacterium]
MIASLTFNRAVEIHAGRRLRTALFERRPSLPVSAACVVANGVREALRMALGGGVGVRLLEPVIPNPQAWALITADARLYRVRGPLSDGAMIIRPADGLALVSAFFGERLGGRRELSAIEEEVLGRAVRSIAATLAPVCGAADQLRVERISEQSGFLTYFELLIEGPVDARIGIALARDPAPAPQACLRIDALLEVELEITAEFAAGSIEAGELLALKPDTTLRMETKVGAPATLKLAGRIVASGECGALGERNAFVVSNGSKGGNP